MGRIGQLLIDLGKRRSGILVLIGALAVGWTSHSIAAQYIGGLGSLEPRVVSLEEWRRVHTDSVQAVGEARIDQLESNQLSNTNTLLRIETMVFELYCDRWPERCESHPRIGG